MWRNFYMWRNYTCGEICLISWADMPELLALLCQVKLIDHIIHTVLLWDICLMEYTLFCQKSILLRYTLFSRETCFVAIYALSVWREIMLKMLSVEKKWQISCMEISNTDYAFFYRTHIYLALTPIQHYRQGRLGCEKLRELFLR